MFWFALNKRPTKKLPTENTKNTKKIDITILFNILIFRSFRIFRRRFSRRHGSVHRIHCKEPPSLLWRCRNAQPAVAAAVQSAPSADESLLNVHRRAHIAHPSFPSGVPAFQVQPSAALLRYIPDHPRCHHLPLPYPGQG